MRAAIRAEGLGKVYRTGFWLRPVLGLESLDLEVAPGQVFGFIGPNGAGKTTTIKILTGLQRATSGRAWIHDRPCEEPAARADVGFLPERPYFYEHLSARELLDFYGRLFDLPAQERSARIERLLERVDLVRFADVPLRKYSKGMLQRVGLCQALLHEPSLVILDEPMSGLDPLGRALVRDLILEERATGRTVFFSSHILSDVEVLCDSVAILVRGRLRGVGTVDELIGARVRVVEITARLPEGAALPPGELLRSDAGTVLVRVGPDATDAAVAAVVGAGGSIVAVTPVRETLERVLLDEVERAAPVDAGRLGVLT